jgi:hypothetical protein
MQKASWVFLGLALFMLATFFFGAPSLGFLGSGLVTWIALVAGMVAGLGAMQCVIFLRRRGLAVPNVTVVAVIVGSITLVGAVFIIAYGFLGAAT